MYNYIIIKIVCHLNIVDEMILASCFRECLLYGCGTLFPICMLGVVTWGSNYRIMLLPESGRTADNKAYNIEVISFSNLTPLRNLEELCSLNCILA